MSVTMLSRFGGLWTTSFNTQLFHLHKRFIQPVKNGKVIIPIQKDKKEKKDRLAIIKCKRKEFNFYQGDVYGKYVKIPLATKGWVHRKSKNDHFVIYPVHDDTEEEKEDTVNSFKEFCLDERICNKLDELGITKPLEIQQLGIPKILSGLNCMLAAETGSGKTMAYLIPMIEQILAWKPMIKRDYNTPLGLILTPTRELAVQIGIEVKKLSSSLGLGTRIFTGGKTKKMLRNPPLSEVDIVVSSFGVFSKLTSMRVYNPQFIRHLVIEEADALFHETFEDKLRIFLQRIPLADTIEKHESGLPLSAQLTLVSATMPSRIEQIFYNIINIEKMNYVMTSKVHRILVPQKFIRMGPSEKAEYLLKYIKPKVKQQQWVIVFSNSNTTADWVKMFLEENEIPTVNLTGSMPLKVRIGQYAKFRSGQTFVLSTTNAASRGLDTTMVNHILNFEFPLDTADYIHRCGRTGRVGTVGECLVTNFISRPKEISLVQRIEWSVRKRKQIPIINTLNNEENLPKEDYFVTEHTDDEITQLEAAEDVPY